MRKGEPERLVRPLREKEPVAVLRTLRLSISSSGELLRSSKHLREV